MIPNILVFAGSLREGSYNRMLAKAAAAALENNGARVTILDLKDYPMPLYDGDLEKNQGMPESAKKFKEQIEAHDGMLVVSPEYNGFFPAVLKNSIDWATRNVEGKGSLSSFENKVAAVLAASPGVFGGLRTLFSIRQLLTNIKVLVIPEQLAISRAATVLTADGTLTDEKYRNQLNKIVTRLIKIIKKLQSV